MSRASRLAELKALRESGKDRLSAYKVKEEQSLYEEVDEEGYKKVVRARLDQDDFVVDDNGQGYADDGREEWMGDGYRGASESEEEEPLTRKAVKRKREEEQEKTEKTNNDINKYFNKGPIVKPAKSKPIATEEDSSFMTDLLGEIDTNIPSRRASLKPVKSQSRNKVRVLSPPVSRETKISLPRAKPVEDHGLMLNTPPAEPRVDDGILHGDVEDIDMPMSDPIPSSPVVKAVERKEQHAIKQEESDDDMEVAQVTGGHAIQAANVNISGSRPAPRIVKNAPYPSPESSSPTRPPVDAVDPSAWNDVTTKLHVLSSQEQDTRTFGKLNVEDVAEDDGTFNMFWTDYTEINGSLCLFGKVKDRKSGAYTSAFVKVDNILRKLFFLPRTYRQKHKRDTSDEVGMEDVYTEVDDLMTKLGVKSHKIKEATRKYAFELSDVPKEANYLKLMYPYNNSTLPVDLTGETFSRVFGTNTALFEQFVLWKNIMGPCWLKIDSTACSPLKNASWCKLELQLSNPRSMTILTDSDSLDAPPMTYMSLALRTVMNVNENKQEILAVSARVYEKISLSDTTPTEKLPCKTYTLIRPMDASFPPGFDALCKKQRGSIILAKNEQLLLAQFLALLERTDPDVLMGHQLQDVDYPILLSRMRERKVNSWHRIGRMRRSEWPKNLGKGGASFFAERQLVSGRLLCDVANDMGKSLMTKCQSWSLTEMSSLYLCEKSPRRELDNDAALKTWATTREGLLNYINHCEADTYFIAAVAMKVQMLPLSKVLTNLAGNSWARTLSGTRAERNEYILLHEFYRNKYICPDKIYGKGKPKVEEGNADGEESVDVKKKDKYKGGLVFEPEKGLYDKYILVMDFNSLYPSIIQEYNICFTTVERTEQSDEEDKIPEIPVDEKQGILPKLIATLVSRRRQVKSLMKDKKATVDQLATWDIKQLALKLTANSMYGCLGYTQSRFYARPLAMLTTFKGREILRSTKDLAESTQLRVIYGDTDSVMINTNADNMEEALKVGQEFKRSVNERYNLLEIDIDNVFRRLLLHAKKKYAAINTVEVDGKYVDKLEVKGLDMKRREYCALSKDASQKLLNLILSGEEPDLVVSQIHDYLRDLSASMREEKIAAQKYIIYTKLGKNPREYPSPDTMPQVVVALRALAAGKTVRVNDVVSYITCSSESSNVPTSDPTAKRAFSPQDVMGASSQLKADVEWYLYKQIFPPIERLCAPIEGTDGIRLAECLGLDTKRYSIGSGSNNASGVGGASQGLDLHPLESQIPDSLRFKSCQSFTLLCLTCRTRTPFHGLSANSPSLRSITPAGLACSNTSCTKLFRPLTIIAQLEHAIRQHTSRYYDAWMVCDDAACGNRTRSMSVYGHRCLGPQGRAEGCLGKMRFEFGERELYNQLLYLRNIFDVDRGVEMDWTAENEINGEDAKNVRNVKMEGGAGKEGEEREKVKALREHNRVRFTTAKKVVDAYLAKCGRVWVQMDGIFGFAMK